jgi:3,4-dihydroxy 2-butanone 4-phosphate synthase
MSAPVYNPLAALHPPAPFRFDPVPEAIEAIQRGEFVVVMDDESRENEGDVICAGGKITQEGMAWMVKWTRCVIGPSLRPILGEWWDLSYGGSARLPHSSTERLLFHRPLTSSGYVCVPMPPKRLEQLQLPPLVALSGSSEDPKGTAYHLTIDANNAKHPVTTGISAHDRTYGIRLLADGAGPEEFTRPGHLVTLRYTPGGVVRRRGHTEAAVGESETAAACLALSRAGWGAASLGDWD